MANEAQNAQQICPYYGAHPQAQGEKNATTHKDLKFTVVIFTKC